MLKRHERVLVFLCASMILGALIYAVVYESPTCITRDEHGGCVVEIFTAGIRPMPIRPDIGRTPP